MRQRDNEITNRSNKLRRASQVAWLIAIVMVSAAAGMICVWLAPGLDRYARDRLMQARGSVATPDDIVIVAIDEASIARLGRFPWPRDLSAQVIEKIAPAQPKVIALNILYSEPTTEASDTALADAISRSGNTVVAAQLVDAATTGRGEQQVQWLNPLPQIRRASAGLGHVNISTESDGTARELPLRKMDNEGHALWSLAVEAVRIELSDGSVVIVQPETRLVVQDYRAIGSLRELLRVFVGRVRIKINHFGSQPNPYRVNSPSASIAVRGTEFGVAVGTGGETEVVVYEGLVEVASLSEPQRRVLVEQGRGVIVRPNEPIRFFVLGPGNEMGESGEREGGNKHSEGNNQGNNQTGSAGITAGQGRENESLQSAAGVYERYIDSIVDSGEAPLPSRFAAFPDSHLDSLENPSYATEFTTTEGRIFLLPSFGGTRDSEAGRALFGFGDPRPVDYSLSPQGSFFKPLPKYRSVVGGSLAFSRNGIQSFTLDENIGLSGPPFSPATIGSRATEGSTTNSFFTASLVAARRFGADGRTSIGVGLDFLSQHGSLLNRTTQDNASGLKRRERVESRSRVQRTRLTVGLTRDIGAASKLGIFYRYGYTSAKDRNRLRTVDGVPLPLELTGASGNSSEIGVRLRGPLTRHLFYGAEGTLLFGRSDESLRQAVVVDSNERSRATRATLGFGLGYALRPRTVFSFDASGGFARTRSLRREDLNGNPLENERQTARFLSLHAAVQADVWRKLFVSGSVLSVTQSRVSDLQLLPDRFGRLLTTDGIFARDGRSRDGFTDYFSNFGVGWRFRPNFLAEYIFSTDFGQTSPRHTLLLRYTFNPSGQ